MPRIPVYNSTTDPNSQLGSEDVAARKGAGGIYAGIGSGLHTVGEALSRFGEMQETTKVNVGASNLQAQWQDDLEKLTQSGDIADPEKRDKFIQGYRDKFQALTDDVTSPAVRAHAEELVANHTRVLSHTAVTESATAFQNKAVADLNQLATNQSNVAARDPALMPFLRQQNHIYAISSGLPPAAAQEHEQKLNELTAIGAINGGIESGDEKVITKTMQDLAGGVYDNDLNAAQQRTLMSQATTALKADGIAQRAAEEEKQRQIKQLSADTQNDYYTKLSGPYDPVAWKNSVLTDPKLTSSDKAEAIRIMGVDQSQKKDPEREARRDAADARREAREIAANARSEALVPILDLINKPLGDPERLNDASQIYAKVGKGLSLPDAQSLVRTMNERDASERKGDGDAAARARFYEKAHAKMVPFPDPQAEEAYRQWYRETDLVDQELKRKGVLSQYRYTEGTPDYIGKDIATRALGNLNDNDIKPATPAKGWFSWGGGASKTALPQPKSEAEYNALPKGAHYIFTDGREMVK